MPRIRRCHKSKGVVRNLFPEAIGISTIGIVAVAVRSARFDGRLSSQDNPGEMPPLPQVLERSLLLFRFFPYPENLKGYVGDGIGFDPLRISEYFHMDYYLREAELKQGGAS